MHGPDYMKHSTHAAMGPSPHQQGQPPPPAAWLIDPAAPRVGLTAPDRLAVPPIDLREAVEGRRSVRRYGPGPLSLDELAWLLWATQGVQRVIERAEVDQVLRTVPSAGARHPFETLLLARRIEGLAPDLYQYVAIDHELARIGGGDAIGPRMAELCMGQQFTADAPMVFIWVAVAARSAWRYHERAWRYMHLDAGHVCQNLYLAAESVGAGCCAIAKFDDERLNEALGLDGAERFVIYMATLGKKTDTES